MKMQVVGITRIAGVSSKSGKPRPYDMPKVVCLQPVQIQKKEAYERSGFGYEPLEVDLDPEAFESFSQVKFPCVLELITDSRALFGRLQTICVGFKVV